VLKNEKFIDHVLICKSCWKKMILVNPET
jgi:hypothetical protein